MKPVFRKEKRWWGGCRKPLPHHEEGYPDERVMGVVSGLEEERLQGHAGGWELGV
jgi:hypothetical protein